MNRPIPRVIIDINREPQLQHLKAKEINALTSQNNGMHDIIVGGFRDCCLGILGAEDTMTNTEHLKDEYPNFSVEIEKKRQGIQLTANNTPGYWVSGNTVVAVKQRQISAAIRDMVYQSQRFGKAHTAESRSELVFDMVRSAGILEQTRKVVNGTRRQLERIVCWGGHTVGPAEYDYCKKTGVALGHRYLETVTGSGPGIMRGALKGAKKGLAEQNVNISQQIGITCPELITVEPPNNYVNRLVILPDVEKRLEAFMRIGNGVMIFPGGAGTAEEFMTALSIKMHARNKDQMIPLMLTGPEESASYVEALDEFAQTAFGSDVRKHYEVRIGDPVGAADTMERMMEDTRIGREINDDSQVWNSTMYFPEELQQPFHSTHANVKALQLRRDQPAHILAAETRKLFKALVNGSVTPPGRKQIQEQGKFQISGDPVVIEALDTLMRRFVAEKRMHVDTYEPCYEFNAA